MNKIIQSLALFRRRAGCWLQVLCSVFMGVLTAALFIASLSWVGDYLDKPLASLTLGDIGGLLAGALFWYVVVATAGFITVSLYESADERLKKLALP